MFSSEMTNGRASVLPVSGQKFEKEASQIRSIIVSHSVAAFES